MSYIWGLEKLEYRLVSIVPSNGWRIMIANEDRDDFYTTPIVAFAHLESGNGSILLCPIVSSDSIGGEWICFGIPGNEDDSIGVIGPDADFPDDAEIKTRLEIVKEYTSRDEGKPV